MQVVPEIFELGRCRGWIDSCGDGAGATLAALKKGYGLGLERLDQTLEEFNAREIRCEGQAFDPRRMNAIDRQNSAAFNRFRRVAQ